MMRSGALALLMLVAACGRTGGGNAQADDSSNGSTLGAPGDVHDTAATLALAATGPGNCSGRWDDQPVTPAQVLERSSSAVGGAIDRAGSNANLTGEALPAIAVTAPANLPFACADSFLAPVRRAGVLSLLLNLDGGGEAGLADFSLSDIGAPPPTVVIAIGASGRLTWNEEATTLDGLPDRLTQLSGGDATMETLRGELELRPAREATFGQVHAVLRAVRAGRVRAALLLPSVTPTRPPPAPAVPPPPANQLEPANAAAPRP